MNDMIDWIQTNWFELGSFLIQLAVLATLAWYGRRVLRILVASYDQNEELRKLTASNGIAEPGEPQQTFAPYGYGGLAESERRPGLVVSACRDLVAWLQAPMGSGGIGPFRRMVRWLQSPMGS